MKTKEIRDLIDFISKSGLNEVNIETEELKLSVKREPDQVRTISEGPAAAAAAPAPAPAAAPAPQTSSAPESSEEKQVESSSGGSNNYVEIKSPMIGTFYRSANPDSPPFVHVGDKIDKGSPVCIIEAMKLFNEIETEVAGTVVKVMVDNATPVEYDQVLFLIDPA